MHRRIIYPFKNHNGSDEPDQSSSHSASPAAGSASGQSSDDEGSDLQSDESSLELPDPIDNNSIDSAELAALVAQYGHVPATAWLESARYRIWRPSEPVRESTFFPVQGYLHSENWIFAWGSPLVSDKAALEPTLTQFAAWVESHGLRLMYCCIPKEVEQLLADMGWSTVCYISEDVIDPEHILRMIQDDDEGRRSSRVKDPKKNLRHAKRVKVEVKHILRRDWTDNLKRGIEDGISALKRSCEAGPQLAASSFDPWLNFENREYWVALLKGVVVGVLILTPAGDSYVIKNAVQFPYAPRGTSEWLIHTVLQDLHKQHPDGVASHHSDNPPITFDINAANEFTPTDWKLRWLKKKYSQVAHVANLSNRRGFRRKFDTSTRRVFVCYPSDDGFREDGIDNLLKLLLH